ncbi:MAG TPA: ABC transporter ATP-binding protein [Jatrophihabitans sp.]|nr:ABC transporter ATP-binding protein [Jatrophihabitans sp.]
MTVVLQLRGVTKLYPRVGVTAIADVDLTVAAGETLAITGPSGSGKSTLLNILGTLERPTSGAVLISGTDAAQLPDRAVSALRAWRLGFVFQQFHLLEHLSVLDNVATGLLYRGVPGGQRRAAAADALEQVGLAHRAHHRPSQLSGGEQQRTAIARAVVGGPDIVLADEPTGNLDSSTGAQIIRLIAGFAGPGTAVVVITHDPTVAASMGRQVRLRDGRVVADVAA